MKKKLISLIMALICAITCVFGLAACSDSAPRVNGLLVAKTGEQPNAGNNSVNTQITYGETPDLSFYKLYLHYSDGDIKDIALDDEKLTVEYSFYEFNSEGSKTIEKLPDEYLAGTYTIQYVYDGNSEYKVTVHINVNRAESGAFSVQPVKSTWYEDEEIPNVILKNPKGLSVQYEENLSVKMETNDANGGYSLYYIKKDVYDTFTEAQKTDYDFIEDFISKNSDKVGNYILGVANFVPVGEYMLFAKVAETYNYWHVVTPAVKITVKNPIIERTFTFKNIVLQDGEGNTVTDTDNEYVFMTANMNTSNQGKTVICKANGEVRGTVDFGNDVFDDLPADEVFKYSINGTDLTILTQDGDFVGDGKKSGNTLTLKLPIDVYYWIVTFTCQ